MFLNSKVFIDNRTDGDNMLIQCSPDATFEQIFHSNYPSFDPETFILDKVFVLKEGAQERTEVKVHFPCSALSGHAYVSIQFYLSEIVVVVDENNDVSNPAINKLKSIFGFDSFRPGQEQVVDALMGRNESALAVFPTGAGKSLCYQLPAACFSFSIVVCPLIALMEDQVSFLKSKNIAAAFLNSTLEKEQENELYDSIERGETRILYVSPERFQKEYFVNRIARKQIDLLVIDEAHCISEWGHSFRPDYLLLVSISKTLNIKRILCTTATATDRCAKDILRSFSIPPANYFKTPMYRQNLHLCCCVASDSTKLGLILASLKKDTKEGSQYKGNGISNGIIIYQVFSNLSSIVYCTLQSEAEQMTAVLIQNGYNARCYHAGVKNTERLEIQNWFMTFDEREDKIVVATIAFGMGVDKSNIRFVYHATLAKSIEGYSQEIGRAGRDGLASVCRTFLSSDDLPLLQSFANGDTPSKASIQKLLQPLFFRPDNGRLYDVGAEVELSHYDLSSQCDMRQNTVNLILCHLYVYGQYVKPITQRRKDKVYNVYRILKHPLDYGQLIQEVYDRQQKREVDELRRLHELIGLFEKSSCYYQTLRRYFGDDGVEDSFECGSCQFCMDKNPLKMLPRTAPENIIESVISALFCHTDDICSVLANDDYRTGIRFLLGQTSPLITKNKLKNHKFYGKLEGQDFNQVHAAVKELTREWNIKPVLALAPATLNQLKGSSGGGDKTNKRKSDSIGVGARKKRI